MKKSNSTKILISIVAVIAVLGIWAVSTYNGLAKQNQDVEAQWSQVENVMQRRYDLVPNLVNSVKGSMKQEKDVFLGVAQARKSYSNAKTTDDKVKANNQLNQQVGTLINAIREDYPELKSNDNVATLMNQLEGSENRISVERKRYNEQVGTYNKSLISFPKNIMAGMLGFHAKDYFKADEGAQVAPKVDFGN